MWELLRWSEKLLATDIYTRKPVMSLINVAILVNRSFINVYINIVDGKKNDSNQPYWFFF